MAAPEDQAAAPGATVRPGDDVDQYQEFRPPEAKLADAIAAPMELASRGTRLGAKTLDGLAFAAVAMIVGMGSAVAIPLLQMGRGPRPFLLGYEIAAFGTMFLAMAGLVVWNCVWLHRYGQTLGKRALRIRIVRTNGERAGLGRIFLLRFLPVFLLGLIPFLGPLLSLADTLLIFRDSRQCLHDQFADTVVVRV
jgi:uncharacterized RDD family membrane protein YckC